VLWKLKLVICNPHFTNVNLHMENRRKVGLYFRWVCA
jgi:hypothetical protein